MLALVLHPTPVFAQDAPQSLGDLIPDEAVADPEVWAQKGAVEDDEEEPQVEDDGEASALPKNANVPDETGTTSTFIWEPAQRLPPAEAPINLSEFTLPPVQPLEADETITFKQFEVAGPAANFAEAEVRAISDELILAFPQTEPPFTARKDFVDRFVALSTIEQLENGDENIAQLAARARSDEELLNNLLRVYGYYDGQIVRQIGTVDADPIGGGNLFALGDSESAISQQTDTAPQVRFNIIPGDRYRFGTIDLGELDAAPDAEALRASFAIATGDFLQSDWISSQQGELDRALGEWGYPFAEIDAPELLIDHARLEGDLTMPVRPGGKYVFGSVTSSDDDFLSGRHIGTIARFDPGDGYKRSLELDLRRAVIATGLVSSATVTPREVTPPTADAPGVVDLDVGLERAKLRTIAGAIGYGTEEGVRVQASWEHRNLFPPEGALKLRGILGTQEQLAGISFRRNNFGGRDKILNVDAYASTIDSPAFDARTIALVTTYERQSTLLFQKPLSWSIGLELIATGERPPDVENETTPRETFFIAAVPGYAQVDTTDDLLDPTEGFRLGVRLSPEVSRNDGSESFYVRGRVDGSGYRKLNDRIVIAGRVALGAIKGADLESIAPSRRLYAGGGGSVRGYGFREIGPRDEAGEPSGGRSLVETAVEARIKTGFLDGAVSIVPFLDAGSVSPSVTPDFDEIKVGAGLGLRYETGFGPLRVDVGVPLNPGPGDSPVAVYLSLGQAF
ncbi:autotransporter assembly complex protein TamA [Qipengyuania sp. DGS5-3]|uniref:autotransporter assembly complex protein TamA n=1 Tax=Qipengyuania sp. DGS5-3 TaxID=3349632 RepID=UPI0036D3941F